MRKYASAEERAAKKQKRPSAILVLQRKYTDFRARFPHCGSAIIRRNAIVGMLFTVRHSSGSWPNVVSYPDRFRRLHFIYGEKGSGILPMREFFHPRNRKYAND